MCRSLRIVFSGLCIVACVAVVALWVRSFRSTDDIFLGKRSLVFQMLGMSRFKSQGGGVWMEFRSAMVRMDETNWQVFPSTGDYCFRASPNAKIPEGLGFLGSRRDGTWVFPCWFPILLLATTAVLPWLGRFRRRYSLRTLLVVMTLAAVGLGAIVYAVR
jgi:hypothetical protein